MRCLPHLFHHSTPFALFFMLLLGYFWDPSVSQCHFLDLKVLELHLEVRNTRGGSLGQGLSTFFTKMKAVAVHCFAPLE